MVESKFDRTIDGYTKMKLLLNEKRQNLSGIGSHMMTRLVADDNDWGAWKRLIEVVIEIDEKLKGDNGEEMLRRLTLDGTLTSLSSLEQYINGKCESRSRGPSLAKIHFQSKIGTDDLDQLIIDYASRFGHKQSCYGDLESYLGHVKNFENLISQLKIDLDLNSSDNADSIACRHILQYLLKVSDFKIY